MVTYASSGCCQGLQPGYLPGLLKVSLVGTEYFSGIFERITPFRRSRPKLNSLTPGSFSLRVCQDFLNGLFDTFFGMCSDKLFGHLAIFKDHQSRDTDNSITLGRDRIIIYI